MSFSYLLKYIIIGDTNVGKSCLLLQFIDHKFRGKYEPTIGVEFGAKTIQIHNQAVKLQIWDTAGQQSFLSITRGYYRSAIGALLVYDITKRQSFKNIQNWLNQAKNHGHQNMVFMLVGNKCDLQNERQVPFQQGQRFAKSHGIQFLEVSAKTSFHVQDIFKRSAVSIIKKVENKQIDLRKNIPGIRKGDNQQKSRASFDVEQLKTKKVQKQKSSCC